MMAARDSVVRLLSITLTDKEDIIVDATSRILAMGAGGVPAIDPIYVEDVFSTWLYTGNDGTQTITNGIDLASEGGMVWVKTRNNGYTTSFRDHAIVDTVRGDKILSSNTTNPDTHWGNPSGFFPSFNSDGFTVGAGSALANHSSRNYASWTFRKAEKFFDVVTFTSDGSTDQQISHNLGSTPGFIIVKETSGTGNFVVYHRDLGINKYQYLNFASIFGSFSNIWGSVAPTSTTFNIRCSSLGLGVGDTAVAYLFAHDAGGFGDNGTESVIKCGSYTGNASGIDLNLGWEPQWVLIKKVSGSASAYTNWCIFDNMRGVVTGGTDTPLAANLVNEENGSFLYGTGNPANLIEFSSTGIRVDPGGSQFASVNTASDDFIYVAIRRGPMKTPEDATEVFNLTAYTGNDTANTAVAGSAGFPVDHIVLSDRDATSYGWGTTYAHYFISKILRGRTLSTTFTSAEVGDWSNYYAFDVNNDIGWGLYGGSSGNNYMNKSGTKYVAYKFRRAPGFFDVVAYTGTGSATTVSHNLGVAPELMIVKRRDGNSWWYTYSAPVGNTSALAVNRTDAATASISFWNNQSPTSEIFYVGSNSDTNGSGFKFVAYLFATVSGVSKVGSYTGTGTTLNIDCGFTSGARFVMIKRTDSTGDWYVWDTARGIVSGNDPYLLLNSTAAEVTNTDYIDPYSAGFQISSTAPAAINASGGSFIFLSIA